MEERKSYALYKKHRNLTTKNKALHPETWVTCLERKSMFELRLPQQNFCILSTCGSIKLWVRRFSLFVFFTSDLFYDLDRLMDLSLTLLIIHVSNMGVQYVRKKCVRRARCVTKGKTTGKALRTHFASAHLSSLTLYAFCAYGRDAIGIQRSVSRIYSRQQ